MFQHLRREAIARYRRSAERSSVVLEGEPQCDWWDCAFQKTLVLAQPPPLGLCAAKWSTGFPGPFHRPPLVSTSHYSRNTTTLITKIDHTQKHTRHCRWTGFEKYSRDIVGVIRATASRVSQPRPIRRGRSSRQQENNIGLSPPSVLVRHQGHCETHLHYH